MKRDKMRKTKKVCDCMTRVSHCIKRACLMAIYQRIFYLLYRYSMLFFTSLQS